MPKKRRPTTPAPQDTEGNKYDKIIKENLQKVIPAFINKVLKIQVHRMENLPQVRVQTTKEAEPDFLKIIYNDEYPKGCILQIEFEAKDKKKTDSKMLEYVGMEHHKYQLPIDLHMIYLLRGKPKNITGHVVFGRLSFSFPIYCVDEISYAEFIYSDVPEEVILAILANPKGKKPEEIVRMILERLHSLSGKSSEFWKFINQLKILSMLRNLRQETQKQVKEMIVNEDIVRQIKEDELYQLGEKQGQDQGIVIGIEQGIEKGIEKGIVQGLEKGKEEGETKKAITAILNMAAKGFDINMTAEVLEVTPDFVATILRQYKKKDKIIAQLSKPKADFEKIAILLKVSPILVEVIKEDME